MLYGTLILLSFDYIFKSGPGLESSTFQAVGDRCQFQNLPNSKKKKQTKNNPRHFHHLSINSSFELISIETPPPSPPLFPNLPAPLFVLLHSYLVSFFDKFVIWVLRYAPIWGDCLFAFRYKFNIRLGWCPAASVGLWYIDGAAKCLFLFLFLFSEIFSLFSEFFPPFSLSLFFRICQKRNLGIIKGKREKKETKHLRSCFFHVQTNWHFKWISDYD